MHEKVPVKKITAEDIAETRKHLPYGYSKIIEEMIDGRYKEETITKMFARIRTMHPIVFEVALKLIDTIFNLINNEQTRSTRTEYRIPNTQVKFRLQRREI